MSGENTMSLAPEADPEARKWAMFCHISQLSTFIGIPGFIGPLVIWLMKKDDYPFVDEQGKEVLNFQISVFVYFVISAILIIFVIGIFLIMALGLFALICSIIGAIKANDGLHYRYPFIFRLL